jgi:erythromycin esterase-like protein
MKTLSNAPDTLLTSVIADVAHPLNGTAGDYDPLLDLTDGCHYVLIGEASHGTHEFYRERAEITRRLIEERGFNAVAVEADWPDAYRANCFVRGMSHATNAAAALAGFKRFPTWMWRNADVLEFISWLHDYNTASGRQVGFFGLDLYSLFTSIEAVLGYLEQIDPGAARRARQRYACFEEFGRDSQAYGYAAGLGTTETCEQQVISQLVELQRQASDYARRDGQVAEDEWFYAEQNARLVKNAEQYYRSMFHGPVASWNLRDRHMAETLQALTNHLGRYGNQPKIVVWAHNSHLGDARSTDMAMRGELNLGQLVRERYGADALSIGFTTYEGTVTAASGWDEPAERKRVRPALSDSYEALFHAIGTTDFLLNLREENAAIGLAEPRLERAIGVIYRPETERQSHYFHAQLPRQFDVVLHFDHTRAVTPMEPGAYWQRADLPETFPTGDLPP